MQKTIQVADLLPDGRYAGVTRSGQLCRCGNGFLDTSLVILNFGSTPRLTLPLLLVTANLLSRLKCGGRPLKCKVLAYRCESSCYPICINVYISQCMPARHWVQPISKVLDMPHAPLFCMTGRTCNFDT